MRRQPVIALDAIDIIAAHDFRDQSGEEPLHVGMVAIHPLKAVFAQEPAVAVARGPGGPGAEDVSAVLLVGRGETEFEPRHHRQAARMGLLDHFGQGIPRAMAWVDGHAKEGVHERTAVERYTAVPDHGIDDIEMVIRQELHGGGDACAALEDAAVDVGEPDTAQLGRGRLRRDGVLRQDDHCTEWDQEGQALPLHIFSFPVLEAGTPLQA